MADNRSSSRRQFLRGTGATLAVGAGISVASQPATAALTDKLFQIEIIPINSETAFDIDFDWTVDPVVVSEPWDGYANKSGATVSGEITSSWGSVVIGVEEYALESVSASRGPLAYGAQYLPQNAEAQYDTPEGDGDRFSQIEVSGDGKYVFAVPFAEDVGTSTSTGEDYGHVWEAGDSVELEPTQFAGLDQTGREDGAVSTFYVPIAVRRNGENYGPVGINFESQDQIVTMQHEGRDQSVGSRFGPGEQELSDRSEPHDAIGGIGIVDGGSDKYQAAAFDKDPATWWDSYDLYNPAARHPCWMRLEDGVSVNVFTTDTDRGCRFV
ncbi:twin-arginine translocation signal domain-containing protein [Halorientalis pallida]|uniref:twin-arginine translocation signal domain-containing protein n=1 Tax=Halorientalis pallida TaxID=2479928 RepID=UPI003C6F7B70